MAAVVWSGASLLGGGCGGCHTPPKMFKNWENSGKLRENLGKLMENSDKLMENSVTSGNICGC